MEFNYQRNDSLHGKFGKPFSEDRLAQLAVHLLDSENELIKQGISPELIYNLMGLTHEECVKAGLVQNSMPYYTVIASDKPLVNHNPAENHAQFHSQWFDSIADAMTYSRSALSEGCEYQEIFMNDSIIVGQISDGKHISPKGLSPEEMETAQDALAAFQAEKVQLPYPYTHLFFHVAHSIAPPTSIHTEFKDNCFDAGEYDLDTALAEWTKSTPASHRALYMTLGENYAGQYFLTHIPIMSQHKDGRMSYLAEEPNDQLLAAMRAVEPQIQATLKNCMNYLYPDLMMEAGKWRVKIIPPGDRYGLGKSVINDSDKYLVEFYDTSQDPIKFPGGQFVTRYHMDTLLGKDEFGGGTYPNGLSLDYSIPVWHVTKEEMESVVAWLSVKWEETQNTRKPSLSTVMRDAENRANAAMSNDSTSHQYTEPKHEKG